MKLTHFLSIMVLSVGFIGPMTASADEDNPVKVTIDNYVRAESNFNMAGYVQRGAFGKIMHLREMVNVDEQIVIRSNLDTLYSFGIFDLTTPVTLELPDPDGRFQSLMCVSEEHSIPPTVYGPGFFEFTHEMMGTRYAFCIIRTFANPNDADDMEAAHALQDQIGFSQKNAGAFQIPNWDKDTLEAMRKLLAEIAKTKADTRGYFGVKDELNPIFWLLGAAAGWGGNPIEAAVYSVGVPEQNDGNTAYSLTVPKDVPVTGFWSITLYDANGYIPKNDAGVYSFNSLTSKPNDDGSFTISFGGDGANNFPLVEGWNYLVRMYAPKQEVIDGRWRMPVAVPAQ